MTSTNLLIGLVAGVIILLIFILIKLFSNSSRTSDNSTLLIEKQISNLTREFNERFSQQNQVLMDQLSNSNKTISQQFAISSKNLQGINDLNAKIMRDVSEKLTKLDDTNKQVVSFADQLNSLEKILKNPKQRGILGEYFLETLLGNLLAPTQFKMQYKFKDGEIVDAVIFIKDTIIPIDAKFSLDNYNKIQEENDQTKREELIKQFKIDLKGRIDETSKYIRPSEKTVEFAFMFIPAEGIFYDLLVQRVGTGVNSKDLIEYAFSKKVIIVSPNSFFAYLQTVLQALKNMQVKESYEEILGNIDRLQKHIVKYDENMQKLGKQIGMTVNTYNSSYKEFKKIDKDITKISGGTEKIEPMLLERPKEFEE